MSDHIYELKSPEQLVIGDRIPTWDVDLEVKHVLPFHGTNTYRVTFTNGTQTDYPAGVAIKVMD